MIGHRTWAIPEGFIPGDSFSQDRELVSHEACCILNAGDTPANIELTLYFENREPAGPYRIEVGPRRTRHLRFNDLQDPQPVPRDKAYASVIRSDAPIVVQHSRLDSRDPHIALLSTIAFPILP
ncbi:MAG TPA: sensory rhodopsin transducer [Caulobacteraceae bacterium]